MAFVNGFNAWCIAISLEANFVGFQADLNLATEGIAVSLRSRLSTQKAQVIP